MGIACPWARRSRIEGDQLGPGGGPDAAAVVGDAVYAVGPAKGPYSRTISAARAGVSGSVFVCLAGHRLPIYSSGSSAESNKIVVNRPW
jgi:hypothetical protein